jgi:hypothetical protein
MFCHGPIRNLHADLGPWTEDKLQRFLLGVIGRIEEVVDDVHDVDEVTFALHAMRCCEAQLPGLHCEVRVIIRVYLDNGLDGHL